MTERKAFFNRAAGNWDKQVLTPKLLSFLEEFVPTFGLLAGQKVLDAGTGTGVLVPFLVREVGPMGHVTAVDFAEEMVDICKSKYCHLPNVSFRVQKMEEIDFPSEGFDCVVCFGLFPHIEDKEKALTQISRVLKVSGRLIIAHALSSEEIEAHHHESASAVARDALPDRHTMKQMLRQAGFTEIKITDEPGRYLCTATKKPT